MSLNVIFMGTPEFSLPALEELIKNMAGVEFHFALEGISGKGKSFLLECIKEAKMFMNARTIDSTKTTYSDLYGMMVKGQ